MRVSSDPTAATSFVDRVGVVLTGVLSWVDGKESPFLQAQADFDVESSSSWNSSSFRWPMMSSSSSLLVGLRILESLVLDLRIIALVSLVIILSVKSKSWSLNYHTSLTCDNSRMFLRVLLTDPMSKSRERSEAQVGEYDTDVFHLKQCILYKWECYTQLWFEM